MIAHERDEEARLRSMQSVRSLGNRGARENFRNGGEVFKVVGGAVLAPQGSADREWSGKGWTHLERSAATIVR